MAYITMNRPMGIATWASMGLDALRERREQYRSYRQTAAELNQLTDRELSDIGISRYDIPSVAREAMNMS